MPLRDVAIGAAKRYLPPGLRDWVVRQQRRYNLHWVRIGAVQFGDLHRTTPVSPIFGIDRGLAVDRYYIERFLEAHRTDIRGRCLEMGDPFYVSKFGDGVTAVDVLHVKDAPGVTIVGDLTSADHIPSDLFDCIVFTQTLQMIYDATAALRTLHRILKPGGVLLLTSHGISRVGRRLGRDAWGEYWRFTTQSAERMAAETFPDAAIEVGSYGNVFTSCCCLHGIVSEEISRAELDYHDPDYEVIVTIRAQKAVRPAGDR